MSYRFSKYFITILFFVISQTAFSAVKVDFTGKWQTQWGEVNLVQTGNKVTGSALGKGSATKIEGKVTGRRLDFKWTGVKTQYTEGPVQWGMGYYELSHDGRSFAGRFGSKESNTNIRGWEGKQVSQTADAKSTAELTKYSEDKYKEDARVHIEIKNPVDEIKGALGNLTKPMESCYLKPPSGGFNHQNRKYKLCNEEQRKIISAYMGTFEGNYSGPINGKVTISVHDDGIVEGYRESGGKKYTLRGVVSFINQPLENYLQIHVADTYSLKNPGQQRITFKGTIKKDGLFNSAWYGKGKKGARPEGRIQLRKTAPHKKRVVAKAKPRPKKKTTTVNPESTLPKRNSQKDNRPLFEAARKGDSNKIFKLANKGYDLTAVDENGATAFQVALKHGHMQAAQTLMAHGSDKNHKDNEGKTPLHYAAIYNVEIIAGALMIGGADPTVKDKSGKTARDHAVQKGNKGVVRMFDMLAKHKAP